MARVKRKRRNPVPPSSWKLAPAKVRDAARLYKDFSGHDGEVIAAFDTQRERVPGILTERGKHVLIAVGYLDGLMYETVRDGKTEKYVHEFKQHARPLLAVSHDGRSAYILGGEWRFTDRGFVDTPRRKR